MFSGWPQAFKSSGVASCAGRVGEQVDFLLDAQAGGVLGGEPRRDERSRPPWDRCLNEGFAGGVLQVGTCSRAAWSRNARATASF